MTDLVIVGDEAWTREEWERAERKREQKRAQRNTPEAKARRAAYFRQYRQRPEVREKHREYNRRWMWAKRHPDGVEQPVGYLHSLSCVTPHWRARKHCTPIPCYSKKQDVAA